MGRARFHHNIQEDQEDKGRITIAVARPLPEEHPAIHVVEHASEYVEGYECDPHEDQERGQDHSEEGGHKPLRRSESGSCHNLRSYAARIADEATIGNSTTDCSAWC